MNRLLELIGNVNYCRDMWARHSHVLASVAQLTSKIVKFDWGPKQSAAFTMAKRITAMAYPNFDGSRQYSYTGLASRPSVPLCAESAFCSSWFLLSLASNASCSR